MAKVNVTAACRYGFDSGGQLTMLDFEPVQLAFATVHVDDENV
jgi:hypothetical protein